MSNHVQVAIETAVAELDAVTPAGTVIAVVVDTPADSVAQVGSPGHQNPAATYGMLRSVVTHRIGQPTRLK